MYVLPTLSFVAESKEKPLANLNTSNQHNCEGVQHDGHMCEKLIRKKKKKQNNTFQH